MTRWAAGLIGLLPGVAMAHPAEDLPAGHWMELSLNTIEDIDPCPTRDCSYSAVEGVSGTINDWCGGVLAAGVGTLGGLVVYGGGHNGYFGSEIYLFDIDTRMWVRHTEPYDNGAGSVAGECNADGVYPDGSPCPPHTYDRVQYDPASNSFVLMFSTTDPVCGGCDSPNAHTFSFDTDSWSLGGTHPSPPSGTGASSAYDPNRGIFWLLPPYNGFFSSYDPAAAQWTTYNTYNISIDGVAAIDPGRDLFVTVEGRETNTVIVHDLSNPSAEGVTVDVDGSSPVMERGAQGFEWDPVSEQFVGWAGGTEVWTLVPPDGDWATDTWSWLRVDAAEENTVTPDEPNSNGTYSRWRHVPSVNVFVVVNRIDGAVWAYRLSDDPGVGPNDDDTGNPSDTDDPPGETGNDPTTDDDTGNASVDNGDGDSSPTTGDTAPPSSTAATSGADTAPEAGSDESCACRGGRETPPSLMLLLLALAATRRRERRTLNP